MERDSEKEVKKPLIVRRLTIENFRGIKSGEVDFYGHALLLGDNNIGKSTICEALELVLGPERVYRRPIVDEHDFYNGNYLDDKENPIYIKIGVILLNLPEELERNLFPKTRPWSETSGGFVDVEGAVPSDTDVEDICRALELKFVGYYDRTEDDFTGRTYFAHPVDTDNLDEDEKEKPYAGLSVFQREHKLKCGFIYLRTIRTGRRAMSLERGSLLDTILRLGDTGKESMWESTLKQLKTLKPPIGNISQLDAIQNQIQERMSRFGGLSPDSDSTAFYASDLTRESLRKVVQLFLRSQISEHSIPFNKLGTGTLNALVFALLTYIAELRSDQAIIFAMEEPEIALPPHSQRRIAKYLIDNMGQAIITSHSPYVIEEFEIENLMTLTREGGNLSTDKIPVDSIRYSLIRNNRRQLAETILGRGVIVAEGNTEAKLLHAATHVFEKIDPTGQYIPLDLIGVSIFDAESQSNIPKWGPFFKALKMTSYAFHDKPKEEWSDEKNAELSEYNHNFETNYKGTEDLLIAEVPVEVLKRFLTKVSNHPDYPNGQKIISESFSEDDIKNLARDVLKDRKGAGFAAMVIEECTSIDEFPETIRKFLERVNKDLALPSLTKSLQKNVNEFDFEASSSNNSNDAETEGE